MEVLQENIRRVLTHNWIHTQSDIESITHFPSNFPTDPSEGEDKTIPEVGYAMYRVVVLTQLVLHRIFFEVLGFYNLVPNARAI